MSEKDKKRMEDSAELKRQADEAFRKAEEEAPEEVEEATLEIKLKKPEAEPEAEVETKPEETEEEVPKEAEEQTITAEDVGSAADVLGLKAEEEKKPE